MVNKYTHKFINWYNCINRYVIKHSSSFACLVESPIKKDNKNSVSNQLVIKLSAYTYLLIYCFVFYEYNYSFLRTFLPSTGLTYNVRVR